MFYNSLMLLLFISIIVIILLAHLHYLISACRFTVDTSWLV